MNRTIWKLTGLFLLVALVSLTALGDQTIQAVHPLTTVLVDGSDGTSDLGGCGDVGNPCDTIQAGVNHANAGETVLVSLGVYGENVSINKNISLLSASGRAATTVNGISGAGALGAVQVTNGTTGVQIGATGQGFTINGIDNGAPGIENAAVYFQGGHSNATVQDDEIVAAGDHGLLTEFGAVISGFVIDNNEFSGKTFLRANPAGNGFSQQFTLANVPRQLAVISGGSGGGNTSNTTFTNNTLPAPLGLQWRRRAGQYPGYH